MKSQTPGRPRTSSEPVEHGLWSPGALCVLQHLVGEARGVAVGARELLAGLGQDFDALHRLEAGIAVHRTRGAYRLFEQFETADRVLDEVEVAEVAERLDRLGVPVAKLRAPGRERSLQQSLRLDPAAHAGEVPAEFGRQACGLDFVATPVEVAEIERPLVLDAAGFLEQVAEVVRAGDRVAVLLAVGAAVVIVGLARQHLALVETPVPTVHVGEQSASVR